MIWYILLYVKNIFYPSHSTMFACCIINFRVESTKTVQQINFSITMFFYKNLKNISKKKTNKNTMHISHKKAKTILWLSIQMPFQNPKRYNLCSSNSSHSAKQLKTKKLSEMSFDYKIKKKQNG